MGRELLGKAENSPPAQTDAHASPGSSGPIPKHEWNYFSSRANFTQLFFSLFGAFFSLHRNTQTQQVLIKVCRLPLKAGTGGARQKHNFAAMATWNAVEIGSAGWEPGENDTGGPQADGVAHDAASAAESGYFPETKDNGDGATTENGDVVGGGGRWAPFQPSEQAVTQGPGSESSAVVVATVDQDAGASGGGVNSLKRHSMAFEIARVERARSRSKSSTPNPLRATHVWSLSRPRYVERSDQPGRKIRLLPGQEHRDAVPYGVWSTSWAQMGDFGLDVGMYFVTVGQLIGAVLVYAALCIVAMVHFSSDEYSGEQVREKMCVQSS